MPNDCGSVVRSRGCSGRCAYWNANFFWRDTCDRHGYARAVVGHRERCTGCMLAVDNVARALDRIDYKSEDH